MKTVALALLCLVVFASAATTVKPDTPDEMDILPCEKHTRTYEVTITKMVNRFRRFFEKRIMFSEDMEEADVIIETMLELANDVKQNIGKTMQKVRRELKKRKGKAGDKMPDMESDDESDPCDDFTRVLVDQNVDPVTGEFTYVKFERTDFPANKICKPESWMAVTFDGEEPNETEDIKKLLRHHSRVASCNNNITSVEPVQPEMDESEEEDDEDESEIRYRLTLGSACQNKLKKSERFVKVRQRVCSVDGNDFTIYKVDGMDRHCPKRPGCGLPKFEKVRDMMPDMEEDDEDESS